MVLKTRRHSQRDQLKKMVSPLVRRSAVECLVAQGGCSERRACRVVSVSRSVVRYVARRREDEETLVKEDT